MADFAKRLRDLAARTGLDAFAEELLVIAGEIEGADGGALATPTKKPDMTQKWCWWVGDSETFHIADTESEAHGEAQCRIDDDCMPGDEREYNVARVQHPIDSLGREWLAKNIGEYVEEHVCNMCDDHIGAEEPSIQLTVEDQKELGEMVAAFVRSRASVDWWTADKATITLHTHVARSTDKEGGAA